MTTANINIKVNNSNTSSRLKQLHNQITRVGKATKKTKNHFKDFNQTMFGATAFVGMFTQAFQSMADTLMKASELDRVANQFGSKFGQELEAGAKNSLGPKGNFVRMIRGMTDNSIDMVEAMKSAIQLRSSGVTGDINTMASIVAKAGTAAKMAGRDSGEGIKRVTDFLKDGSLAHLQHLGLLRTSNPALKAYLAVVNQAGGVLGTAMTAQQKLALGMRLLDEKTRGYLRGQRDLRDTLQDTNQFFSHLKDTVGIFIGKAIQPLLESFIDFSIYATAILEDIKKNKKELLFLTKGFIIATAAVSGFVLVLGSLALATKALTSLVAGIPFLTVTLLSLGAAAIYTEVSFDKFIDTLSTFAKATQGVYQLVTSFVSSSKNFSSGVGMMDKSIHDFLKEKGLLTLVTNISRVISIVTVFVRNTAKGFVQGLTSMLDKLGSVGQKLKEFLGLDSGPWKRNWLDIAKVVGQAFGKMTAGALAFYTVMKLIRTGGKLKGMGAGGLLSKGFGAASAGVGLIGRGVDRGAGAIGRGARSAVLGGAFHSKKFAAVAHVFAQIGSKAMPLIRVFGALARFTAIGAIVGTLVTGFAGLAQGLIETSTEIGKFVKAVTNWVSDLFETNPILSKIKNGFTWLFDAIVSVFGKIKEIGHSIGVSIGTSLGQHGQMMHDKMYNKRMSAALNMADAGKVGPGSAGMTMPENQTQALATIIATMRTVSEDKMDKMTSALEKALGSDSAGGLALTPEEWTEIFASGMDKSKKVGQMANANKNVDDKTKSSAIKSGRSGVC